MTAEPDTDLGETEQVSPRKALLRKPQGCRLATPLQALHQLPDFCSLHEDGAHRVMSALDGVQGRPTKDCTAAH